MGGCRMKRQRETGPEKSLCYTRNRFSQPDPQGRDGPHQVPLEQSITMVHGRRSDSQFVEMRGPGIFARDRVRVASGKG
jgi:hypothetical protein